MPISASTYWEPLELSAKIRDVVVFTKSKYKSNTQVLETLKFIKLVFGEINVAGISIVKDRKDKGVSKRNSSGHR